MTENKENIVAVGAGRMGRGIAHVFAYAGHPVTLLDFKERTQADAERLLEDAKEEIKSNLEFLQSLDVLTAPQVSEILERITFAHINDASQVLKNADVIFEGVTEILEIKENVFRRISQLVPEKTVIASTTSTISVDALAEFVSNPSVFLNAHWLNPAYLIPLVEVSPGDRTAPETVDRMMVLLERVGKVPVRCKASPGYIIPRIQCVAMNEAVRLVEEGVASPEDIDKAIRFGFGVRYTDMGLLEFVDWGGVDILYYASNYLQKTLDSDRYTAPSVIEEMMQKGQKGLREGQGFYDFRNTDVPAYQRELLGRFVALLQSKNLLPPPGSDDSRD